MPNADYRDVTGVQLVIAIEHFINGMKWNVLIEKKR